MSLRSCSMDAETRHTSAVTDPRCLPPPTSSCTSSFRRRGVPLVFRKKSAYMVRDGSGSGSGYGSDVGGVDGDGCKP
ncbi:hypothetical protein M0804_000381 [Polistes exclamans]|nr:hypothetical protein M0804_000381 [Polistes exclamans]